MLPIFWARASCLGLLTKFSLLGSRQPCLSLLAELRSWNEAALVYHPDWRH